MANANLYAAYDENDKTKEPGTQTGTKIHDVVPEDGKPGARLTARLCNFPTNVATLRLSHRNWIRDVIRPAIGSLQSPWVDLVGYASQLRRDGRQELNALLSNDRCRRVREEIENYSDRIHWNVQWPKGAAESGQSPDGSQNEGWWRAVTVSVWGYIPPHVTPVTVSGYKDFEIRLIEGGSGNVNPTEMAVSPLPDLAAYVFEIVALKDGKRIEKAKFWHAAGAFTIGISALPLSPTHGTGVTTFHTSVAVELHDFEGQARVFSDGQISVLAGGTMRLAFESDNLARRGAVIRGAGVAGNIVPVENSNDPTGISLGTTGFPGPFKMMGTTIPVP